MSALLLWNPLVCQKEILEEQMELCTYACVHGFVRVCDSVGVCIMKRTRSK